MDKKYLLFVMGVSGCGKSTIGKMLAESLHYPFFDGDDY
ncbi:MAG: gluconate kinase, partial [Flavobacteriales bacterium]